MATLSDADVGLGPELSDADVGLAEPVDFSKSLAKPGQLDAQGNKPYAGYLSAGPFSPYQAENMREAVSILGSLDKPAVRIPRIQGKTTTGKLLAAPVNVASGLVEGLESPVGLAATALGGPVVKGLFAGLAAKEAGRALGEASVTKDPQAIAEGVLGAGFAPFIALHGTLGEKGTINAKDQIESPSRVPPEQQGVAPERPTESQAQAGTPQRGGEGEQPLPQPAEVSQEVEKAIQKTPPSGVAGEAQPSAGPGGATMKSPVPAGEIPQAIKETTASGEKPQVGGEPIVGPGTIGEAEMGAAGVREIPETGAGGEKYGVAERVRDERAKAGQVDPVPPNEGISTQDTIQIGRDIIQKDPAAPERVMAAFEADPQKNISTEGISVVRAHGEALAAEARRIEGKFGTESPEYKAAKDALSEWDRRSKAMQTEWHKSGMAQQGETDLDTGSFTGIERAVRESTGKDIPAAKKPRAKKLAQENKQAQEAQLDASDKLKARIREKNPVNAEKAAIDAANKTVRENAVRLAESENKSRVAEQAEKQAVEQVQKDAAQAALEAAKKTTSDAAVRKAREENKARVEQAKRDKQVADVQAKAAKKALEASQEVERQVRERAIKEAQRRANDPSIAVWEKANEYLDDNKGIYSFDDIRNKIATDLGMSVNKVTSILAQDPITKRLADDLWNKQRNARRLKESAKAWIKDIETPGYLKALSTIPRAMFSLKVGLHGTVALGTHAPMVAFQPRFWGAYVKNFGRMYRLVFSPTYYERQVQDLVRRPNYELARRAGLQNDPFQYEEYHTATINNLVKNWIGEKNVERLHQMTSGGNRGYSVLKILRQDMFDQMYDQLPRGVKVQKSVPEALSKDINHVTGVTETKAPAGSNVALFAPRLMGSRVMWLAGDPLAAAKTFADWKNASTGERLGAINQVKEKAWVFGTAASLLALNQGFLSASGSKQKINGVPKSLGGAGFDPLASDFLKFKAGGLDVAYGSAMANMAKLPIRVATAIAFEGKTSKLVLEDERVYNIALSYLRTQLSPFAGTLADLTFGRDYAGRPLPRKALGILPGDKYVPKRLRLQGITKPYSWKEYSSQQFTPIPISEGIREVWKGMGMPKEQQDDNLKALIIISIMAGTGSRVTEDTRKK